MADQDTVFEVIRRGCSDQFDVDAHNVKLDSNIIDDIGIDSLGLVESILWLEEEFDLDIPDEDCATWRTIGDVVEYVEKNRE